MLKYGIPDLRTFYDFGPALAAPLRLPAARYSFAGARAALGRRRGMKTTLAWLKTHLDTDAPLAEIAERLVMLGHDVESVENRAAGLEPLHRRIGDLGRAASECRPAPGLRRRYRHGSGAGGLRRAQRPRRHEGRLRARPARSSRRTGALLKETVIRGVASRGMLCSAYELGLGEDHDGIIELPEEAPVGTPYADLVGLDDAVLDIKVTPNRADCLGVRGIARDLAAAGLGQLEAARYDPGTGPLRFADRRPYRGPRRLSAVSRPAHSRRPQRPEPAHGCGRGSKRSGCGRSRHWSTSRIS